MDFNDDQGNTIKVKKMKKFEEFRQRREVHHKNRKDQIIKIRENSRCRQIDKKGVPQTEKQKNNEKTRNLIS